MSFPIFNCGSILFRNQKLAFDVACCCGYMIPCCSPCYFPVGPQLPYTSDKLGAVLLEEGGPSQIQNFRWEIERIGAPGGGFLAVQDSVSLHQWVYKVVNPIELLGDCGHGQTNYIFRPGSLCAFYFHYTSTYLDGSGTPIRQLVELRYYNDGGMRWRLFNGGLSIMPGPGQPPGGGIFWDECGTVDVEFNVGSEGAGVQQDGTHRISFDVVGAKRFPDGFECRNSSGSANYVFNSNKGRWALESDLKGFL